MILDGSIPFTPLPKPREPKELIETTVPAIAERLRDEGVDAAALVPA